MKKCFILILIVSLFSSCASKIYPVKNTYASLPFTVNTSNNFDQVWDKLIDLFAQKGLSIKLIDRSSGLIISDNSAIFATWEDKSGKPTHTDADIVVPKKKDNNLQLYVPYFLYGYRKSDLKKPSVTRGEWNVRIKKNGDGSTINVNLTNVTYTWSDLKGYPRVSSVSNFVSTGNFENTVADLIK